jgi:hypothetical protein
MQFNSITSNHLSFTFTSCLSPTVSDQEADPVSTELEVLCLTLLNGANAADYPGNIHDRAEAILVILQQMRQAGATLDALHSFASRSLGELKVDLYWSVHAVSSLLQKATAANSILPFKETIVPQMEQIANKLSVYGPEAQLTLENHQIKMAAKAKFEIKNEAPKKPFTGEYDANNRKS